MKISILCSDERHPVNPYIERWISANNSRFDIEIVRKKSDARGGDILFLISCAEIISAHDRAKYRACLVLHASDLPKGRGWSPHIWQIVEGADEIVLTLLEAEDAVDSGRIWKKIRIPVPKHALWDEINHLLFSGELELIDFAVENFGKIEPQAQKAGVDATYYARRTPRHSELDVHKSIADQFDLIRVCDPQRFPAYFEHLGHRYILKVERCDE